jgi:protein phosphatase
VSTLVLPDPSLVVLVGAAGSGKSTLARRLFAPEEIVSSDALRAAVSGNEAEQSASRVAFRILHRTVDRRLANGQMTVVDATNTRAEHRRPLLRRARAANTPAVAVVLDLPPPTVLMQNAARRERVVDAAVVKRHLAAIRHDVDRGQLTTEGFDHVVLLQTPADADSLRIEARSPTRPREPAGRAARPASEPTQSRGR